MTSQLIKWNGDYGHGPDGVVYVLFSELIRGESRYWWGQWRRPDAEPGTWERTHLAVNSGTKKGARRQCEAHARRWADLD